MEDVLKVALTRKPKSIAWNEEAEEAAALARDRSSKDEGVTAH
jgi:hypothetical protein